MARYKNVTTGMVVENTTGTLDGLARWRKLADDEVVAAPEAPPAEAPTLPAGEPDESWKVPELIAYATEHNIDLGDATKKADILAALTAPEGE